MKKEKIKGLSNTEKVWWIKVSPTNRSIELLDEIMRKYDSIGLLIYDEKIGYERIPKIEECDNLDFKIINKYEESGYIIFTKNHINIILLKNCKYFNKLKEEIENNFELKENKK